MCCFERFLCKFPFPLKVALMLEYKLLSNNYCKHSKTVIKIKLPNVKCHSLKCSLKKHLNNQKGTHESILCSHGINKCKWTAIILGFLFVDSDVNILLTKSKKLYVWLTTYPKKSSHNLRLHTYIQIITSSRETITKSTRKKRQNK